MMAAEPITVCTFGFNVPCRRFLLTANVTRDRRLPVVDEFVLRALKLSEAVPAKRLAAYFGFSDAEAEIVFRDLAERGLVTVDGDDLSLHPSAHEHFRNSDDGAPRVVEIDSWVDRLWFDLISRNMMAPDRFRPLRNLIDLPSETIARDLPVSFARKAFEENFVEYLRKVKRINNPDRIGLYSVSEVQPERFGSIVLKGWEDLVLDPEPRLRAHLLDIAVDNLMRYMPLANAMTDAYRVLKGPESSSAALDDFKRLLADTTVENGHQNNGTFDLASWLSANTGSLSRERRTIIGASYLGRNIDLFTALLPEKLLASTASSPPRSFQLTWFRPGGTAWGTSPDLQDAIFKIKGVLRAAYPRTPIRTTLVVPQVVRRDNPFRFERSFDDGFAAPAGYLSPGVEILHLVGVGAMVLAAVRMAPGVSITVGFALVDESGLQRVDKSLDWDNVRKRAGELWVRPGSDHEEEVPAAVSQGEAEEDI